MSKQVWKVALGNRNVSCDLVSYRAALNWSHGFDNGKLPAFLLIYTTNRDKRNALIDVDINGKETIIEMPIAVETCGLCGNPLDQCHLACTQTYTE